MRSTTLLAVVSLALSACATPGKITADFDQAQDFSKYTTFAWAGKSPMVVMGNRVVPAIIQADIADSIKNDLQEKGYRYTQNLQEADFAVSFTIGTRDGVDVVDMPDYFWQSRASWSWGNPYWPQLPTMASMRSEIREYTEGTLAVDVYDVRRRAPVWHGAGTRRLSRSELQGKSNQAADAVRAILGGFPPK